MLYCLLNQYRKPRTMLKYILVTMTILLTGNIFAQESTPAFVSSFFMEWFQKEVSTINQAVTSLETANSHESIQFYGKIKSSLNRFKTNLPSMVDQIANHMDQAKNDQLKQEYIDGIGVKYYVQLEQKRNSDSLIELQMTQEQMNELYNTMTELSKIRDQFLADNRSDQAATLSYLKNANLMLGNTESLLEKNSIN